MIGAALFVWHASAWKRQRLDPQLDETTRAHYHARFRRRRLTAVIIAVLGILIPLEALFPTDRAQSWIFMLFTLYCGVLLLLALWIFLLALGDLMVTRAHTQASLSRLRGQQLALERQLAELKSHRSNGHVESD